MKVELSRFNGTEDNKMSRRVRDAVIAAAGYGTRFLPYTTVVPKELLPLGGIPVIHRLINECIEAGIRNIFVMTRPGSTIIRDHFQGNDQYAEYLRISGKSDFLSFVEGERRYAQVNFIPVDPNLPYGNAQGILTIQEQLRLLPNFLLLWGDDIVLGEKSSIQEIITFYEEHNCDAVIGAQKVDLLQMKSYGNLKLDAVQRDRVTDIITKPKTLEDIVSCFAILGQMVVPGDIFDFLKLDNFEGEPDVTGIALKKLAQIGTVLKVDVSGRWVTVGDPENYLKAMLTWFLYNGGDKNMILNIFNEFENGH